jgi:hypothetical protein
LRTSADGSVAGTALVSLDVAAGAGDVAGVGDVAPRRPIADSIAS